MSTWILEHSTQLINIGNGVLLTIALMALSLLIGLVLSIVFSISALRWHLADYFVRGFVFVFRGTPLLVQIFLIYYGLSDFVWVRESIFWSVLQHPFGCAVIALALNSAAYTTVLLKGALQAVPKTEIEAGQALGMSWWLIMRRVTFPHAVITMWSAYSNEPILVLKATALASTITLMDLMGVTQQLIAQTYDPMTWLLIAGIIYGVLAAIIVAGFKQVEKRFQKFKMS